MVLVDTSVWIRFLAGREPQARGLDALLARDEVLGHELIYGELLIGDRGGRDQMLTAYGQMVQLQRLAHAEVVMFVRTRKLHGRGIGWTDAHLLASATVERCRLWTADSRVAAIAQELGLALPAR